MGRAEWKDLYAADYYRMTGELYHGTFKNYVRRCFQHNLQLVFIFESINITNRRLQE